MEAKSSSSEKKKVLITGATGLLGRAVMKVFEADSEHWEVLGVGLKKAKGEIMRVDLTDFEAVTKLVTSFKPDVIVHSAAERRGDVCEQDKEGSRRINVDLVRLLASLCKKLKGWLLFISSDHVFDGTKPPYSEGSMTNPLHEYGRQKRDAEIQAREADWGCGVLRVPLLYGEVDDLDQSQVSGLLQQILEKKAIVADDVQVRYPTLVDDVAFTIKQLAERKMEHCGLSGVWHWSGSEPFTRYTLAKALCSILNLDGSGISASHTAPAVPRPENAKLDVSTLRLMGVGINTPFADGVKRCYTKWVERSYGK